MRCILDLREGFVNYDKKVTPLEKHLMLFLLEPDPKNRWKEGSGWKELMKNTIGFWKWLNFANSWNRWLPPPLPRLHNILKNNSEKSVQTTPSTLSFNCQKYENYYTFSILIVMYSVRRIWDQKFDKFSEMILRWFSFAQR